jgi:glucose/arabinose dehydrogenase
VTEVAGGLVHPYSIMFTDARTLLVAERPGRLRMVRDGVLLPKPVWQAAPAPPGAPNGGESLHFIALHPAFDRNHLVYLSYPKYGPKGSTMAVGRGTLMGEELRDFQELFVAEAWERSGANPGRMLFLRDGTFLVTVGDRDGFCCDGSENTSQRMKAQTLDNDFGKILRLRDDGSIPPDNPFVGRAGARPESTPTAIATPTAWRITRHRRAVGVRDRPARRRRDQRPAAGHNYGWPLVSTGRNYTGTPVSDIPWHRDGMDDARMSWIPSISPSGLIFYTGDRFKGWKGSAFLGALNGKALWRVSFDNPKPQQAEQREVLLTSLNVRVRDVLQGPDGNLYIATENESTGAAPNGTVLRIEPAP